MILYVRARRVKRSRQLGAPERLAFLPGPVLSGIWQYGDSMRKVIYGVGISLDGYIALPDGSVDWMWMDPEYDMGDFFKSVDVAIMGRRTLDDALKHGGGAGSFGPMACYVLSRTRPPGKRDGVEYVNAKPSKLVSEIRRKKGKHIWLMGGGDVARSFLQADLVDEIYLGVLPILLGEGLPCFPPGFPRRRFKLTECTRYPTGMLSLVYQRALRDSKAESKAKPAKRAPAKRSPRR